MEGLYGLANICEVLCYNSSFDDYEGRGSQLKLW